MNKKLKLLLSILAVSSMMGVAASCGGSEPADSSSSTPTESSTPSTPDESTPDESTPDESTPDEVTKYVVKFVDEDDSVISEEEYEEGATVTVPADPTKEADIGYTYAFAGWDKEVTAANGNVTYKATYTKTAIEYTITFVADGATVETLTYTVETEAVVEPTVPAKAGYGGAWEAYALDGGNKTVNAVYTAGVYTVTFKVDGVTAGTATYTVENKEITVPEVPAKAGYTGAWEAYELTSGDVTVNAVYTAIEYTVTFKADGATAGTATYTVENKEITAPAVPEKAGYTGAWEAYELTSGDVTVNAVYTAIEYTVTFKNGEEVVGTATYTVENKEITVPEVPAKEGYTGAWEAYELTTGDVTVSASYEANTYKIIYTANGGTLTVEMQDVVYGEAYTLATAIAPKGYQEFLGWTDENGNQVVAGESWNIASNVTLTAIYSEGITFSSMTEIPSYMKAADTTESLTIEEVNGNKVLRVKNKEGGNAPALIVTRDFLATFFEDENVAYVAFDAKAELGNYNNFRRVTKRANGTFAPDCYVTDLVINNVPITGIRNDAYKTFYFSRADYQSWIDNNVTEQRIIASGGIQSGDSFYVDNIRPVTQAQFDTAIYSFEGDGVRINDAGRTLLFYTTKSVGDWSFNFQVGDGQTFTNVGYTNENVTDGIRALTFTKVGGNVTLNLNSAKQAYADIATKTGFWAIDVYVPEGANARVSTGHTGLSNGVIPGATLTNGAWTTIYMSGSMNALTIGDENGGTYYVDNLRSISAEEYQAAQYGFEFGTVGLRTNLLNDANTHSGAAYIYNKGNDYTGVKASMSIAEGNGEKDGNAVSNVRFETEITHSGNFSIAFDKGNGYSYMTRHVDSEAKVAFDGGFTFWIYSTVDIDGVNTVNMVNGVNNKFNGGEGIYIKANTWTQVTVNAEEIGNGRFLILQGSWEGTIYVDDFQPLE